MVEQAGVACDVAVSGEEAIEMAQEYPYSLVLMDLMMGDIDGWTASKRIREGLRESGGVMPTIVAVTGLKIDNKLVGDCTEAGMDEVIQKPVSTSRLRQLLADYNHLGQSA